MLQSSDFCFDSLLKSIKDNQSAILDRFCGTIKFPTLSALEEFPLEPFLQMHRFSSKAWSNIFSKLSVKLIGGASLLIKWQGSSPEMQPVMLTAHQDVVPAGDAKDWTFPPFDGVISNGRVYGRGTVDYKCGFAGMLEAVSLLIDFGFNPTRTIYLAFGHDEEVGGLNGASKISKFLKEEGIRCSSVLDEGGYIYSDSVKKNAEIAIAEKGYASFKLTARAKQGHASVPSTKTAIGMLSEAITLIDKSNPPSHIVPNELSSSKWLPTTIAPTIFSSGCKENVLPAKAEATLNTRPSPGSSVDEVLTFLTELCTPLDVEVELIDNASVSEPSAISSIQTEDFFSLKKAISATLPDGIEVGCGVFPAATDSRRYCTIAENVYRFMPVFLGDAGIAALHSIDESISVSDYLRCVEFYARYISEIS